MQSCKHGLPWSSMHHAAVHGGGLPLPSPPHLVGLDGHDALGVLFGGLEPDRPHHHYVIILLQAHLCHVSLDGLGQYLRWKGGGELEEGWVRAGQTCGLQQSMALYLDAICSVREPKDAPLGCLNVTLHQATNI